MCVHTSHCCRVHGCKYGDWDCPVWLVEKAQEYPCEMCDYYYEEGDFTKLEDIPKIPLPEIQRRRSEVVNPFDELS